MSHTASSCAPLSVLLDSYDELVDNLRVPRLDRKVHESVFLQPLRDYRRRADAGESLPVPVSALHRDGHMAALLGALQTTVSTLRAHEQETVHVLRLIDAREEVMARLVACDDFYTSGKSSVDDAQVTFMVIVEELQVRTLQVVEAIEAWRTRLCRPFPFRLRHSEQDYLQRIGDDCRAVTACTLGQLLGLHLDQFPCCSNLDLPRVVRRKQLMRRAKLVSTGAMWQLGFEPTQPESAPAQPGRSGSVALWARGRPPPPPPQESADLDKPTGGVVANHADSSANPRKAKQKRLLKAEAIILGAARAEENLMESMWQLAHSPTLARTDEQSANSPSAASFAPLLYMPTVLRYDTATGSCVPAAVAPPTAKEAARSAPKNHAQRAKAQQEAQRQLREAACLPLESTAWTSTERLQRDACEKAVVALAAAGTEQFTSLGGAPRGATHTTPKANNDRPPRHYESSSSSSTSSRDSSSLSASSRSSSSSSGSASSSRSEDSGGYQPYASTESSASSPSGTDGETPRGTHDADGGATSQQPPVRPTSSSSSSSHEDAFAHSTSEATNSDKDDASSSADGSEHASSHDEHRRLTQDESLEILRQQLLEERRLSMSRSQSQNQSQQQTPIRPAAREVTASAVPLPVPSPPRPAATAARPSYDADEFDTASDADTTSSD